MYNFICNIYEKNSNPEKTLQYVHFCDLCYQAVEQQGQLVANLKRAGNGVGLKCFHKCID